MKCTRGVYRQILRHFSLSLSMCELHAPNCILMKIVVRISDALSTEQK